MMKTISTETCIPMGRFITIYSDRRIYIRVRDEAAGPYLAIEGVNDEPDKDQKCSEFYLESIEDIDEFATICKQILKEAQNMEKKK